MAYLLTQMPPLQEKKKVVYNDFGDKVATGLDKSGQPVYGDGGKAATNGGGGGAAVSGGKTQTAAPVQRANAFQNVGGKGMTIGQRRTAQEQNNVNSNDAFLQAAASDNLARHERNAQNAAYQQGLTPNAAKEPYEWQTNMAQFRSGQRQNEPMGWGNNSNDPNDLAYKQKNAKEDNSFQAFRAKLYDEDKIRRQSDTRAKVLAFGDALRNIGHLYEVGEKGASPQTFNTDFASAERDRYEQGRQNRDATAYKMYQADLAQKAQEAERQRKDLLAQSTMAKDKSTMQYNEARTNKTLQDMGINAAKAPYELRNMAAQYDKLVSEGNKAAAEALYSQIKAEWAPKIMASEEYKNRATGDAAKTNAAANMKRANAAADKSGWEIKKIQSEIENGVNDKTFQIPDGKNPGSVFRFNNSDRQTLEHMMKGMAKKKLDEWGISDESDTQDLLSIAYEHYDDEEMINIFNRIARDKNTKTTLK